MSEKRKYDSTVARIAGNILSGARPLHDVREEVELVQWAVSMARCVVREVERTEITETLNVNAKSPARDTTEIP